MKTASAPAGMASRALGTHGEEGFILLEIMAALIVLAVALGPMVGALVTAGNRAGALLRDAADGKVGEGVGRQDSPPAAAWGWGTQPTFVGWDPGPALDIHTWCDAARVYVVGLWIDGWFCGDHVAAAQGIVKLEASLFSGWSGREVVVRVKVEGGEWGPPWRSVVPEACAPVPPLTPARRCVLTGTDADASSVVHIPSRAQPVVFTSAASAEVLADASGLPLFLHAATMGRMDVSVGSEKQSWCAEEGRALDVYF